MADWVAGMKSSEVEQLLQSVGVPAGRVQDADQLVNEDPQLMARGFWREIEHPIFGRRTVDTFPALLNGVRPPTDRLSPTYLGEHNFDVWTELADFDVESVAEAMGNGLFS
jgi:crotonobetainyl-CoA:carnitine CoA-transferase CaiB-like acyl-CoA transferase